MREIIQSFLSNQLLVDFTGDVNEESDLFELGLIDSYAYIELIRFLEAKFRLQFSSQEILTDVRVSLSGIVALVASKQLEQV
jgi:D-alanine--poly(phosphoribitol) ligase subunit 2